MAIQFIPSGLMNVDSVDDAGDLMNPDSVNASFHELGFSK